MLPDTNEIVIHRLFKVVGKLADLFGVNNDWAITGSANLAIRGARIRPSDIDIIMTRDTADQISDENMGIIYRPFSVSKIDTIQSYYAKASLCGVPVDLMANAQIFTRFGTWQTLDVWRKCIEHVQTSYGLVPLTSLAFERCVYTMLDNQNRIKTIDKDLWHRAA